MNCRRRRRLEVANEEYDEAILDDGIGRDRRHGVSSVEREVHAARRRFHVDSRSSCRCASDTS